MVWAEAGYRAAILDFTSQIPEFGMVRSKCWALTQLSSARIWPMEEQYHRAPPIRISKVQNRQTYVLTYSQNKLQLKFEDDVIYYDMTTILVTYLTYVAEKLRI